MKTYKNDDKLKWGEGPWVEEPDKAQWIDEATGLDCLIVRNHWGALCGYVGVPPEHKYHGIHYSDYDNLPDFNVHGGLTYAAGCQEGPEETSICHVPEEGRPVNVWWFGFDCGHSFDLIPHWSEHPILGPIQGEYRNFDYVKEECSNLARQLAAV